MSRTTCYKRTVKCPSPSCDGDIVEYEMVYAGRYYGRPEDCYPEESETKVEECTGCGKKDSDYTDAEIERINAEFESSKRERVN